MADQNRELREERGRIAKRMAELSDGGIKTPAEKAEFERLDGEQKRLKDRINLIERSDEIYRETRVTGAPPRDMIHGEVGPTEQFDRDYRKAFDGYLRAGFANLSFEDRALLKREQRDMGTAGGGAGISTSGGGIFVPVGFQNAVEVALKYFGPMLTGGRGNPRILDTENGQILPYPASNDTSAVGELIGENQQVTTDDLNLSSINFGSFKFSSKMVKVSLELLQDSAFDLDGFLVDAFATRLGRILNTKFTVGAGTTEPTGILTAVSAGGNTLTAAGANTNDGVSGANTIGSDDLVNLEHAVDPLYRPGAKYMMADATLKALKKVKDKYGRPLWQESTRDGAPALLNGYEYLINNDFDTLQTQVGSPPVTKRVVLFGALEKFVVRRVRQFSVLRLSERFADFGQVAFIAFARYDSNSLDVGNRAFALLETVY